LLGRGRGKIIGDTIAGEWMGEKVKYREDRVRNLRRAKNERNRRANTALFLSNRKTHRDEVGIQSKDHLASRLSRVDW
jgi:hypothetical protein